MSNNNKIYYVYESYSEGILIFDRILTGNEMSENSCGSYYDLYFLCGTKEELLLELKLDISNAKNNLIEAKQHFARIKAESKWKKLLDKENE